MLERVLIWNDGSSEALFADGSVIFLKEHCSSFDYVSSESEFVQTDVLTRFACDERNLNDKKQERRELIRTKLLSHLHFVNSHVTEPFLNRPNVPISNEKDVVRQFNRIIHAHWVYSSEHVKTFESGAVQIVSVDGHAKLTIMPNRRRIKVVYLAEIIQGQNVSGLREREFIPLHQHFSVSSFPHNWLVPFSFAMFHYMRHHGLSIPEYECLFQNFINEEDVSIELPVTKPDQHTYRERQTDNDKLNQRAKILNILHRTNGSQGRSIASCVVSNERIIYLEYIARENLLYQFIRGSTTCELHAENFSLASLNGGKQFKLYACENDRPYERTIINSRNRSNFMLDRIEKM